MYTLALCLFLPNLGITEYNNYNFSSLVVFGDMLLGGNENGIFILNSTDKDIDSDIDACFEIPRSDLGSEKIKRVRALQIDGDLKGEIEARVIYDDYYSDAYSFGDYESSSVTQQGRKVPINWEDSGSYIGVEVRNINGADFSIDKIRANVTITNLKSSSNNVLGRCSVEIPFFEITS